MGLKKQLALSIAGLLLCGAVSAADIRIAVASNFSNTMHELGAAYNTTTGHSLKISSASTGKLYAQIKNGAPFDMFFSADAHRAQLLVDEGLGLANSLRSYALGQLVLISSISPNKESCINSLSASQVKRIAIANPVTAPYGLAAQQTLQALGLWQTSQSKLVRGENIAQTLQFFHSGNAQIGFIAKSQLHDYPLPSNACAWDVPSQHYQSVEQKMVVLKKSAHKPQVVDFAEFMRSEPALNIIKQYGYQL